MKNLTVRGKPELMAVFEKYKQLSGKQNTGRPQAVESFIRYIAGLEYEEAEIRLKAASKQTFDLSNIETVPSYLKIVVDIDDELFEKAQNVFANVFSLKNVQTPYFIRVAGTAYINHLCEENVGDDDMPGIEEFLKLSIDEKLVEIYKLLLERK